MPNVSIDFSQLNQLVNRLLKIEDIDRLKKITSHGKLQRQFIKTHIQKIELFQKQELGKKTWEIAFDAIADPIALINKKYRIIRVNKAFSKKVNISTQLVRGRLCHEVFQNKQSPCKGCLMRSCFKEQQSLCFNLASEDGEYYRVTSFPLLISPRKTDLIVQHYQSISKEKILRERIATQSKLTEIGIMAGSIAHEMNNPLAGIIAFIQIAIRDHSFNRDLLSKFRKMEEAAEKCKKIVQMLLNYSRMNDVSELKKVKFKEMIETSILLLDNQIRKKKLKVCNLAEENYSIKGQQNHYFLLFIHIFSSLIEMMVDNKTIVISKFKKINYTGVKLLINQGIDKKHLEDKLQFKLNRGIKQNNVGFEESVGYNILKECKGKILIKNSTNNQTLMFLQFKNKLI